MQGRTVLAALTAALVLAAPAEASKKLSVVVEGVGRVAGAGLDCSRTASGLSGTCTRKVKARTATLQATAGRAGFGVRWTGCSSSTATTCTVRLDRHRTVTARFADATAPRVAFSDVPGFTNGAVVLTAEASDNDRIDVVRFFAGDRLLREERGAPYTADLDTTAMPEGPVVLRAVAVDPAGHQTTATHTLVVDRTAPVVTLHGTFTDTRSEFSRTVRYDVRDASPIASVVCLANGFPADGCAGSFTVHARVGFYSQSAEVSVRDAAGNVGAAAARWKADADAPALEVFTPYFVQPGERPRFLIETDDGNFRDAGVGVASVTCAYDGAPPVPCDGGFFDGPPIREDRPHELVVVATDRLGNARTASATVRMYVD